MNWFYWNDGERIGPISAAELKRLAQTGVVSPSTTVEDETGKSALAERVAGLFASPSSVVLEAKVERLAETLAAFETRLGELTERLERVEARVADVENKESEENAAFEAFGTRLERWDAALTAVVGKIDALTEQASKGAVREGERSMNATVEKMRVLSERLAAVELFFAELQKTRSAPLIGLQAGGNDAFELPAGTFYVGTDLPPGRYRATIKKGQPTYLGVRNRREIVNSWALDDKNSTVIVELNDGWKIEHSKPMEWRLFASRSVDAAGSGGEAQRSQKKLPSGKNSGETAGDYRLPSGKHRVGIDIPPGRYRAEIRRGYALVEVETRDDYEGYNLDTDVDSDTYNPSCVLELRSGAKLTLDKPTDFTYLGALR